MKIKPRFRLASITFILCSACFAGCSKEETPQVNRDADEIIPEMPEAAVDVQPVAHRSVSSPQVSLKQGDQYYFVKSIEQKLGIEPGSPIGRVWERVEFLFSLTVREESADGYILDVAFHNVLYQSERGEHHLQYDSRSQAPVPPEVLPYRRMIDRGFRLHLDRRNRIVDVVGFDEFLAQCFAEYPAELQQKLMLSMSAAPDDRINSAIVFLDESFALLPFHEPGDEGDAFPVGSHWTRTLTRTQPVPVSQTIEATLQNIFGEGEWAQVVISGELKPARRAAAGDATEEPRNRVAGGTISGSCSVSLTTGLPKTCRIQREILMELSAGSQPSIPVRKTIVTTLEAWSPPATSAE
jgi:hypothetical protein